MHRRTFEGHMDWEYQNPRPMDPTSPFGQLPQKPPAMSSFNTQSSYGAYGTQTPNPFAATASNPSMSPSKPQQHQQQSIPALNSRLFEPPQLPKQFAAPQFRNPAFTTPQRRGGEELVSECSGAEESPAATDMSECLADADTPEVDRSEDFAKMTITPHKINRGGLSAKLFSRSHAPGRGEVPRGRSDLHHRDKVRKRKRLQGDKDVGSVRARLPHDSDDSDSDWPDDVSRGRNSRGKKEGWFRSALTAIHDHPNVPAILAGYIHLAVWLVLVSFGVFCLWGFIATFRSDIALASDQARAALLEESRYCASQYTSNQCSPRQNRPPALEEKCNEWEACMHQDADRVHQVQVSAKNIAEIINEFAGVLSIKAYGLIVTLVVLCALATNVFNGMSRNKFDGRPTGPTMPFPSAPVLAPMLTSPGHDPNMQFYLPKTPGRMRAMFITDDATDTDASPSDVKAIMPPQTPSGRRSPYKGERGRSPTKLGRSPSKGY